MSKSDRVKRPSYSTETIFNSLNRLRKLDKKGRILDKSDYDMLDKFVFYIDDLDKKLKSKGF
jgi:hypothetical protein